MGQKFEKNKNSVSENKETRRRIGEEGKTLAEEFSPLRELTNMLDSLEDNIADSVRELESVKDTESQRLLSEQEQADAEKEKITADIYAEIEKLEAGVEKLNQLQNFEFGKKAASEAQKSYNAEKTKLQELLDELDDRNNDSQGDSGSSVPNGGTASWENSSINELNENEKGYINDNSVSSNSLFGGNFVPLKHTAQGFSSDTLHNGRQVTMFDHPFSGNSNTIHSQGSAFPDGPTGTCGCCASGTIINKAGGHASEHSVVTYALKEKLCNKDGGTSPDSWVGILKGAGIPASNATGSSLEDLAAKVESGHGVIIGVSASAYNPKWYGIYLPGFPKGHALVLESVIRDSKTGRIVSYVVADSNGDDSRNAVVEVPKRKLERAYSIMGKRRFLSGSSKGLAVVTDDIIW